MCFYALSFAGKIEETYYAVDINEALLEVVEQSGSEGAGQSGDLSVDRSLS